MRKLISRILVLTILITMYGQMRVCANEEKVAYSQSAENMVNFIQSDFDNFLLIRKNYAYMTFVENFESDWLSLYFLEMADIFVGTGAEPDEKKYMEVLVNIITTYDMDNASNLAEQYRLDNLKGVKGYAMDLVSMGEQAISIMVELNPTASELESGISTAISGISTLADNTDNWIEALSNLETIVDDYTKYDNFLKLIEENADGKLREAATILRSGMKEAMYFKLSTYTEVENKNFDNYSEFFFDSVFFPSLKQTSQYGSDENFKCFVDFGNDIVSKKGILKDSWDLGTKIGKLVGDIAVGGEDIINRVLEMMALYDISVILQEKIIGLEEEFIKNYGMENEEDIIGEIILYSQYLIGCRIRGEYCIYSTVANDAGLLSWFNKEDAEQAKEWYKRKVQLILTIQENLLDVCEGFDSEADDIVDVYNAFINEKKYEQFIDEWVLPATEYAILDINQDGIPELLINSEWDIEWRNTLIFSYDVVSEEVVFIKDIYHCYDIRYSSKYRAIEYTDIKPSTMLGISSFDTVEAKELVNLFVIGRDTVYLEGDKTETYNFIHIFGEGEEQIKDEERQEYFSELNTVEFTELPIDIPNNMQEELREILTTSISDPILNFLYDDFDNNGSFEAIAFCGEYSDSDGSYFGTLYFVSENGIRVIREKDGYWDCGEIFDFGNAKIITITKYFTTGGLTYYYQVNGDEIIEIEGSGYGDGLYRDEYGRICMTDSQYDACVDGTGHTWNVYYFYWNDGLREYGGTQITTDEFSSYNNADTILKKISEDGFYIASIYKRQNGIININCCDGWNNCNLRVIFENGSVEVEKDFYESGIIRAAMVPEIATY